MNKDVIILRSEWNKGRIWEEPGKAPFQNPKALPDWLKLKSSLPLPGVGVYRKKYEDRPIKYLQIKDIYYNESDKRLYFDFEPISTGKSSSVAFSQKVPERALYSRLPFDDLIGILKELSEDPPPSWIQLALEKKAPAEWRDHVGKHYLRLEEDAISSDDFEDIVFDLFVALGFDVKKNGHARQGKYPDGTAISPDPFKFALIYDCKSSKHYYPNADASRALAEYSENLDPEIRSKHPRIKNVYLCIVAKSFESTLTIPPQGVDLLIDSTSLIYLLYNRLTRAKEFKYNIFNVAAKQKVKLDAKLIDKEMGEMSP
jgi:hypothetical protein